MSNYPPGSGKITLAMFPGALYGIHVLKPTEFIFSNANLKDLLNFPLTNEKALFLGFPSTHN